VFFQTEAGNEPVREWLKELPDADRERIKTIVHSHPSVRGIHDMRTRSDSDHSFMELHVEMDAGMSLREAHEIAETITDLIQKALQRNGA